MKKSDIVTFIFAMALLNVVGIFVFAQQPSPPDLRIIVIVNVLFGTIGLYSIYSARKRDNEITAIAKTLGWKHRKDVIGVINNPLCTTKTQEYFSPITSFALFSEDGLIGSCSNIIEHTTDESQYVIFDYMISSFSKRRRRERSGSQTILWMKDVNQSHPHFLLKPEGLSDKLASAILGAQDFDFPTHEHFSRNFVLSGNDETQIRALFSERLIKFFEQRPGVTVEGKNDSLLIFRSRTVCPPSEILDLVNDGMELQRMVNKAPL